MKKSIIFFICAALVFTLSGCSQEQTEDIIIMYTNDVASEFNGEVGIANVKGFKDLLKSENNYVALVDAGDYYDGWLSKVEGGKYIVEIMNAVGYDAAVLGNQEFAIGLDALAENIAAADFDHLSCNLKYIGHGKNQLSQVKPYVIRKYGPTRVAFVGVTTPETNTPGKLAYEAISDDNGDLLYYFYDSDDGPELYEQVQKTVDKARKKADYVIVLSHLGSNSVRNGFSSYDLIENTNGIDVVIDAHSHTVISGEGVMNKDGDQVVLTSTGEELENLGVLWLHPDRSVTSVLYSSVPETDLEIQAMVDEIYEKYKNQTGDE